MYWLTIKMADTNSSHSNSGSSGRSVEQQQWHQ